MFEWIQHEPVGRDEGLTTAQLLYVRDISKVLRREESRKILSDLQYSALAFADESTTKVKVSREVSDALQTALGNDDDLIVEAASVVAIYNMVSRFLVSLDVAGLSDELVPWPSHFETVRRYLVLHSDLSNSSKPSSIQFPTRTRQIIQSTSKHI